MVRNVGLEPTLIELRKLGDYPIAEFRMVRWPRLARGPSDSQSDTLLVELRT